mmetsp:Transcript_4237/g.11625  ORF Transcript_4237/g.11625 Transcript_4237/m.11625 type:complete len:223 (+) Transcript_4237:353-1021(+)
MQTDAKSSRSATHFVSGYEEGSCAPLACTLASRWRTKSLPIIIISATADSLAWPSSPCGPIGVDMRLMVPATKATKDTDRLSRLVASPRCKTAATFHSFGGTAHKRNFANELYSASSFLNKECLCSMDNVTHPMLCSNSAHQHSERDVELFSLKTKLPGGPTLSEPFLLALDKESAHVIVALDTNAFESSSNAISSACARFNCTAIRFCEVICSVDAAQRCA